MSVIVSRDHPHNLEDAIESGTFEMFLEFLERVLNVAGKQDVAWLKN
jgi:hypothetical protein